MPEPHQTEDPIKLRDLPTGTVVDLCGTVVSQDREAGRTLLVFPGVGASGIWAMPASTKVKDVIELPSSVMAEAAALLEELDQLSVPEVAPIRLEIQSMIDRLREQAVTLGLISGVTDA